MRFLFDYVSPYSYLASTQIRALAARHGRAVEAVPVLFAGLLDASGARGPAEIPAKREYMFKDIVRQARALGVPIAPPAAHPFNPLLALRATGCIEDAGARWALVDALFGAAWARAERIDDPQVVASAAREAGLDGAAVVGAAVTDDAKTRLRRQTDEAIARGTFGVPTVSADGELFWGLDALPMLERFLDGERPLDEEAVARWRAVSPSATRRVR